MDARSVPGPWRAKIICATAAAAALASACVIAAAVLAPAPPAVVPLIVLVCIGCPVAMAWHVPVAIAVLRGAADEGRALAELRATLDRLPEIAHPLDR